MARCSLGAGQRTGGRKWTLVRTAVSAMRRPPIKKTDLLLGDSSVPFFAILCVSTAHDERGPHDEGLQRRAGAGARASRMSLTCSLTETASCSSEAPGLESLPPPFPCLTCPTLGRRPPGPTSTNWDHLEPWPNFCNKHLIPKRRKGGFRVGDKFYLEFSLKAQAALGGVEGGNPLNQNPTIIYPVI